MKAADNERLVRVGPGTAMGDVFRRYWQPVLLSSELPGRLGPPIRVRILGEDLIAFRDAAGNVGLVDAYCPHRRAPLFYARNEECGLRCVYHGWQFNTQGDCVDMPNAPEGEEHKKLVKLKSYPATELGDVVWTYMGPPDLMPAEPNYEWVRVPASHKFISKTLQENNYLQALEGGLDTSHSSFLHNETIGVKTVRNLDRAPTLEINLTDYGYNYVSTRKLTPDERYLRVYQYIMPAQQIRGDTVDDFGQRKKNALISGHVWVPVDDYNTCTFNFLYAADDQVPFTRELAEQDEARRGCGVDDFIPGTFRLKRNLSNDHMIDRELQKKTFTGIKGINTQDIALQEGMGPINDRSKEYLVSADRAIVSMRRLLLNACDAVSKGEIPPGVDSRSTMNVRGHDFVTKSDDNSKEISRAAAFW